MVKNIMIGVLAFLCVAFFFFGLTQRIGAAAQARLARLEVKAADQKRLEAESALNDCRKGKN